MAELTGRKAGLSAFFFWAHFSDAIHVHESCGKSMLSLSTNCPTNGWYRLVLVRCLPGVAGVAGGWLDIEGELDVLEAAGALFLKACNAGM